MNKQLIFEIHETKESFVASMIWKRNICMNVLYIDSKYYILHRNHDEP